MVSYLDVSKVLAPEPTLGPKPNLNTFVESCFNMSSYHHHQHAMYHDNPSARSPGSHRHQPQSLHRQSSRQFDAYGPMPSGIYSTGADDHMTRYDTGRMDRLNPTMHGSTYGYDMPGAQTWNANGFGGAHTLGGMGGTGRMKVPGRGRTGIPTVGLSTNL